MTFSLMADSWISLAVAIIFGVIGTISMKLSHGLTYLKYSLLSGFFYIISFIGLTFAIKYIELSVVYAIWSGVGTLMMAAIGIFYFNESVSMRKLFFLCLIIAGVVGMHLSDGL